MFKNIMCARKLYKSISSHFIMVFKLIDAVDAKPGATITLDGEACLVKMNDVSKSGKHGASKCRIEAVGVIDGKKRVLAIPGHERFEVPDMEKRKAQVLSVSDKKASIMDLESFETMDMVMLEELVGQLGPEDQVEYIIINETQKVIRRKL